VAAPPAKLKLSTKLYYGLGQAAEGIKNYAFENFLFFYYNQVLGLSGTLTGAALFITLMCDAVMDPLAGSWSDNLHHRWGRRHPFMYASAIPLALTFAFVFSAPGGLGQLGLFLWLTAGSISVRAAMALYHVPHLALGAELSSDYQERTAVVGYRIIFAVVGTILLVRVAWNVFFVATPDFSRGQLNPAAYPGFGWLFGIAMMVAILVSSAGTHSSIPSLPKAPDKPEPFGLRRVFGELGGALKNASFRFLFIGIVIFFVMRGIQHTLGLHMFTYFWQLSSKQIEKVQTAMVLAFAVGVPVWAVLSRRLDKKPTLIIGIVSFSLFNLIPPMAVVLGAWPETIGPESFRGLVICMALAAFGGAGGFVAAGSMLADVTDEHELATNRRQEGIFFGALSFAGKSAAALGLGIAGATVDLIGFPQPATVGAVSEPVLRSLAIVYGPGIVILAVISLPFLFRYRITRARHAEILRELATRRESALSS
jgi:glycoside/pentoside/hexuronide:cation symporter, GPH family